MDGVDLGPLLDPSVGANQIDLFGVRIGGAADGLRRAPLTSAAPPPGEGTVYRDDRVLRVVEGELREVPLARLVEEVLEHHRRGVLRAGDIEFVIRDGLVECVYVRGPSLDVLRIVRADDIRSRFGVIRSNGEHPDYQIAIYPERNFCVAWDSRGGRLAYVGLGNIPTLSEPRLGARDLLELLLESWAQFERHDFGPPPAAHPPPLWHRYLRANTLCVALDLGSLADVVSGAFLKRKSPTHYAAIAEQLRSASGLGPGSSLMKNHDFEIEFEFSFIRAYRSLLEFRRDAEQLISYNRGWLECTSPVLLGMIRMTKDAARPLVQSIEPITKILVEILDPWRRSFTRRELVERFGYSDVDLNALDAEWR